MPHGIIALYQTRYETNKGLSKSYARTENRIIVASKGKQSRADGNVNKSEYRIEDTRGL